MIQGDPEYKCEFFICVAMYNEGPLEFFPTIEGTVKNLKAF
jgi:hypothetical protein